LSWRTLLRRFLAIAPVVVACAVFLPFVAHGAPNGGAGLLVWNLAGKATLGVLCITLLNECTPFPDLLHALEHLRVPRLLVVVLGFTHRYAFVVVEEARRMVRARDARAWRGRRLSDAPVIGRMVGALFLRSYERSERIHLAMLARGFHGHMPGNAPHELRAGDYVFFAVTLLIFLALRVELCR
jgi:cobalt/nickel transport system permease protein